MGLVWKQPEGKPTLGGMLSPVMSDGDDSDLAPRVVYYTFHLTNDTDPIPNNSSNLALPGGEPILARDSRDS